MPTHTAKTRGLADILLYEKRLEKTRLTWPQQILDLVEPYNIKKVNDLGCNYFQFYKEMKIRKLRYDYFGYDLESQFVDIGLKKFVNLKKKYKICNIETFKVRKCDLSIISATLEHVDYPMKVLKNLVRSTRKIIIIRGYFGEKEHRSIEKIQNNVLCNHNQFSFKKTESFFKKNKFKVNFILDKATNYSNNFKLIDKATNYFNNFRLIKAKKRMYICFAVKDEN